MRYIDAEKLTMIIEERKAQQDQWINRYHDPINQGISLELAEILSIIASLQQEQTPTEREIAEAHHYVKMIRERDKARIQQESSEVDLEKEAVSFCFDNGINISPRQAKNIARHFYELGLNARKEK